MHNNLKEVVEKYSTISGVDSILLFGSRVTKFYNESSDYDLLLVFSEEKPSKEERAKILQQLKIHNLDIKPDQDIWHNEWILNGESFTYQGINVDSGYQSLKFLQAVIQGVAIEERISLDILQFRPYTLLGLLEESELLFDRNNEISKLRKIIRPFPRELKKSLIKEGLDIVSESLSDINDYCNQSVGNCAFLFHLLRISNGFCMILYALNEKYDPSTKRVEQFLTTLTKKPTDFINRFEKILEGPFDENGRIKTVNEIKTLFEDIKTLIQLEML